MPHRHNVDAVVLSALGGYTRDSLGEEPAEWVFAMYRYLRPPEEAEVSIEEKSRYQESLYAQGLPPEEVARRMRERW